MLMTDMRELSIMNGKGETSYREETSKIRTLMCILNLKELLFSDRIIQQPGCLKGRESRFRLETRRRFDEGVIAHAMKHTNDQFEDEDTGKDIPLVLNDVWAGLPLYLAVGCCF